MHNMIIDATKFMIGWDKDQVIKDKKMQTKGGIVGIAGLASLVTGVALVALGIIAFTAGSGFFAGFALLAGTVLGSTFIFGGHDLVHVGNNMIKHATKFVALANDFHNTENKYLKENKKALFAFWEQASEKTHVISLLNQMLKVAAAA